MAIDVHLPVVSALSSGQRPPPRDERSGVGIRSSCQAHDGTSYSSVRLTSGTAVSGQR